MRVRVSSVICSTGSYLSSMALLITASMRPHCAAKVAAAAMYSRRDGHVHGEGMRLAAARADVLGHHFARRPAPGRRRQRRAALGQRFGHGAAQAAGRAGDEDAAAGKIGMSCHVQTLNFHAVAVGDDVPGGGLGEVAADDQRGRAVEAAHELTARAGAAALSMSKRASRPARRSGWGCASCRR